MLVATTFVALATICPQHTHSQEAPPTPARSITILYSSNTNGIIRSCRCPGNLFGSLPQWAKVINDIRKKGRPVLLVDPGGLFPPKDDKLKAEYVLRCYAVMDYDAIGIGQTEFACGAPYLGEMMEESELPFTSANIVAGKGGPHIAPPKRILDVSGIKVAVISIVAPKTFGSLKGGCPDGIALLDPREQLKKHIAEVQEQVDLIVVLSHQGLAEDKATAMWVGGIDVIVGGHSGDVLRDPVKVGRTLIVQAGKNAEYIGALDLTLDQEGGIVRYKNEITPLTAQIPNDREVAEIAEDYRAAKFTAMGRMPLQAPPADVPQFVPSAGCKKCHEKQFAAWSGTTHARAFETLQKHKRQNDPECYYCHTTGYGIKTGFRSVAETPELASVQCQGCHLVAVTHGDNKEFVIVPKPISGATCLICHTTFNSPKFDYEQYLAKVKH